MKASVNVKPAFYGNECHLLDSLADKIIYISTIRGAINLMKEPESTIDEEDKDMITDETIDLSTLNLDEFDDDN